MTMPSKIWAHPKYDDIAFGWWQAKRHEAKGLTPYIRADMAESETASTFEALQAAEARCKRLELALEHIETIAEHPTQLLDGQINVSMKVKADIVKQALEAIQALARAALAEGE